MGINSDLRISDLLQLRIGHFLDDRRRRKRRFWIHEQKRNKRHEVVINKSIRKAIEAYLAAYPGVDGNLENFVFFNTKMNDFSKHNRRGQVWKFNVSIRREVG